MTEHSIWVFIHILLFVYWLGGDLGVLILARAATQAKLSFAERVFSLKMSLLIDVLPRICFALMFPVGLQICRTGGFAKVGTGWLALAWVLAAAWVALIFAVGKHHDTPLGAKLGRLNLAFQSIVLFAIVSVGLWSLFGEGPFAGGWLAAKVLLFGLIFAASIGIDFAFRPVAPAFMRLATEGSKPDIEREISRGVNGALVYVYALYALLVVIAFLGVTKPF